MPDVRIHGPGGLSRRACGPLPDTPLRTGARPFRRREMTGERVVRRGAGVAPISGQHDGRPQDPGARPLPYPPVRRGRASVEPQAHPSHPSRAGAGSADHPPQAAGRDIPDALAATGDPNIARSMANRLGYVRQSRQVNLPVNFEREGLGIEIGFRRRPSVRSKALIAARNGAAGPSPFG